QIGIEYVMMIARDVAPFSCAKPDKIWNAETFRNPAIMMCTYSPRGIRRLCRVIAAAANKVTAPMLEPARRRLHGETSRRANAAAIQFNPQANASRMTSSLAVAAPSAFAFGFDIARGNSGQCFAGARYSARVCLAR